MYLITMTTDEIRKQWDEDWKWLLTVIKGKLQEWRRDIAKVKKDRWPFVTYFRRQNPKNGNDYVVSVVFTTKADYRHNYFVVHRMALLRDEKGRMCALSCPVETENTTIIYSNHFLKRYAERRLSKEIKNEEEMVKTVSIYSAANNLGGKFVPVIYKKHRSYQRSVRQGLELCQKADTGTMIALTFLVPGQLCQRQKSDAREGAEDAMLMQSAFSDRNTFDMVYDKITRDNSPVKHTFAGIDFNIEKCAGIYKSSKFKSLKKVIE